jgi:hypothetical protein
MRTTTTTTTPQGVRVPMGYTVLNADGAWLADRGGYIGWTTDPSDPDIFTFETAEAAAASAEPAAGERVAWKDRD